MKDILIGKADIKELLSGNFIYVDKTEYIYSLIRIPDCYFLSRPRRFGKSLLISTLFEIFSGNKELFKECWIYKNTDYDWKSYPIINLDFAKISNNNSEIFKNELLNSLIYIAQFYEVNLIDSIQIQTLLGDLLIKLYEKYNEKVVILIDEYDKPLLDNIDNLEVAKKNREIMKDLYTIMKSNSKYIRLQFVTGITKFSQTSLFSGPNNLFDISTSYKYSCLLGYTQKELEFCFHDYLLEALKSADIYSSNIKDLLIEIKNWYNGYLFTASKNPTETLYNPFSILNFFQNLKFEKYWFKTGTPSFLIKLLNQYIYEIPEDENNIYLKISELEKFEIDSINLISLLFQAGYLTIESYNFEEDELKLRYPNQEVRNAFIDQIQDTIIIKTKIKEFTPNLKEFIEKEDWKNAITLLHTFFKSISYGSSSKYEHHYASIFQGIFLGAGFVNCDSEVHLNDGRIDMVLYANKKIYIIEFKLDSSPEKAIAQIKSNKYMDKFLMKNKPIILIGVNFDSDEKGIDDWKVEEYKFI